VQLKDLRNALATGAETDFDAPITALFEALYASAAEHGFADADHAGLWLELAVATAWPEEGRRTGYTHARSSGG
jgi:2-hydroxy-3-oxopropionate reductase